MLKSINIKLDTIEGMLYFWQSTSENEKVGESYLIDISKFPYMSKLYDNNFTEESVRKVLSAISNRELLNNANKTERKFWNNNMWMTEDLEFTNSMVAPIKTLNLNNLIDNVNNKLKSTKYEEIEIYLIPGHTETYYIEENKLIINFFKIMPDIYGTGDIKIEDQKLEEFVEEKIIDILK